MDKYTVDLDKVLNDFEFSELTEHNQQHQQHDVGGGLSAALPPAVVASSIPAAPSKHSINNVFDSLNAYVTSAITINKAQNGEQAVNVDDDDDEEDSSDEDDEEEEEEDNIVEVERVQHIQQEIMQPVLSSNEVTTSAIAVEEDEPVTTPSDDFESNEHPKQQEDDNNDEVPNTTTNNIVEQEVITTTISTTIATPAPSQPTQPTTTTIVGFDLMSASPVPADDSELCAYLDTLMDEAADDDENVITTTTPTRNDNEVVATRPHSLDIADEKADDDTDDDDVAEVNVIGNPGSTPSANNPSASFESEESESASMSPTFSEASTDSVHSDDEREQQQEVTEESNDNERNNVVEAAKTTVTTCGGDVEEVVVPPSPSLAVAEIVEEQERESSNIVAPVDVVVGVESHDDDETQWIGRRAPTWIPDADAFNCLHCDAKFTLIKRRHHCRACGLVLCAACCHLKHHLAYLDAEARVCAKCYTILDEMAPTLLNSTSSIVGQHHQPNPNNPMEYCSVVPPPLQPVAVAQPPSVMVPVGVLKRHDSTNTKSAKSKTKSVMFCDGIRPGSDLTNLDQDFNYNSSSTDKHDASVVTTAASKTTTQSHRASVGGSSSAGGKNSHLYQPELDTSTHSFIPVNESCLPPTVTICKSDIVYTECANNANVVEMLKNETLTFALQRNLHVHVRLIDMSCCINKHAWCFSSEGLIAVGQDEIVVLLECNVDEEKTVPKDVFMHLNHVYSGALKGTTVTELGLSVHPTSNFLGSPQHAGFIFIRPTFQCLQNVIIPREPYLIGLLVHKWETPWAKIFPLRLVLRLGAEYRYYPSPIISTRERSSVFVEIGHTIINLLADFRNFNYTLPNIRGLTIHMREKNTTVQIPANRYEQVMKAVGNSSEHILAFGGCFSSVADSHLVCIQDVNGGSGGGGGGGGEGNGYTTHAINIQNTPRQVTGASFIVFNGALKSSSGLTAKTSIVEDGLMIQIPHEQMMLLRESLRTMKDHRIVCGCVNSAAAAAATAAATTAEGGTGESADVETVNVVWTTPDANFNVGVQSSVDGQSLSGVPSIRVHNGKDYVCNSGARLIRWTEVFILKNGEENPRAQQQDPIDVSKVAECIAKATCQALVKYLDLLASNQFHKIGVRTTLHVENINYSAGGNAGVKLPPIYMKSLDNELVPTLQRVTLNHLAGDTGSSAIVLELIFRILNV